MSVNDILITGWLGNDFLSEKNRNDITTLKEEWLDPEDFVRQQSPWTSKQLPIAKNVSIWINAFSQTNVLI